MAPSSTWPPSRMTVPRWRPGSLKGISGRTCFGDVGKTQKLISPKKFAVKDWQSSNFPMSCQAGLDWTESFSTFFYPACDSCGTIHEVLQSALLTAQVAMQMSSQRLAVPPIWWVTKGTQERWFTRLGCFPVLQPWMCEVVLQ